MPFSVRVTLLIVLLQSNINRRVNCNHTLLSSNPLRIFHVKITHNIVLWNQTVYHFQTEFKFLKGFKEKWFMLPIKDKPNCIPSYYQLLLMQAQHLLLLIVQIKSNQLTIKIDFIVKQSQEMVSTDLTCWSKWFLQDLRWSYCWRRAWDSQKLVQP